MYQRDTITVDLSAIPDDAEIHRAVLVPNRQGNTAHYSWRGGENKRVRITPSDKPDRYLQLRSPRFLTLNATEAVRRAIASSKQELELKVESFPYLGHSGKARYVDKQTGKVVIRLDVTTDQPPARPIAQVDGIRARHENGDTLVTWTLADPVAGTNEMTGRQLEKVRKAINNPQEIRYRVYRSQKPITSQNIGQATLVGEVDPLAIWNDEYWARQDTEDKIIPRFPVAQERLGNYDTGIFVRSAQNEGEAYYAVSKAVDGAEDLSGFSSGENALAHAVDETTGYGMVLPWKREKSDKFYYEKDVERNYYVKWESPPHASYTRPFNYAVAEKAGLDREARPDKGRPVDVQLHAWGGWIHSGHIWWHRAKEDSLWVLTNQRPYDWWTGYNENLWTLKPLKKGQVRLYTQNRIRAFVDHFVRGRWQVDPDRIMVSGQSMGGSGASLWGIRSGEYFSHIFSGVGVHVPADSPQFTNSFAKAYGGEPDEDVVYDDTSMSIWEYEDNVRWLRDNIAVDTPHITFSNGRNDGQIGWPQAWKFARALIETKRPFTFRWSMEGHGARPKFPGAGDRKAHPEMDFRANQSVPAFANGGLDQSLGSSPQSAPEKGRINYWYLWDTESVVDTDARWVMSIFLPDNAPEDVTHVNLTPRRLQRFSVQPGATYDWTNTQNEKIVQEGTVTADEHGLVTLRSVRISKDRNRIALTPSSSAPDETAPGKASDLEVTDRGSDSLTLAWTAPGDDGDSGTAASYDIRYSRDPITPKNWNRAKRLNSAVSPRRAGSEQSVTISALDSGQTYYLALVTIDGAGNRSPLSTVARASTLTASSTVTVSSKSELYEALSGLSSHTTVEIENGTYAIDRELHIGPTGGEPLRDVTLKGKSGDRDAVVLQGNGMENGKGANILLKIRNAVNCTVKDMTLRDAHYHLIQVKGEQGAHSPHLQNLHLIDAGQQFVKIGRADDGVIENSTFEFTDHAKVWENKIGGTHYYTKAIDILHQANNWRVSNNVIRRIRSPQGPEYPGGITKAAIEVWRGCKGTVVERNLFLNCDRAIFFGNTVGNRIDHYHGIIRNNIIYRDPDQPGDTGIALNKSTQVKVYHNTVILNQTFGWNIEYRRFEEGKDDPADQIKNNLTDGPIRKRDQGRAVVANNLTSATPDWFQEPSRGDLHLAPSAEQAIGAAMELEEVRDDFDGQARPMGGAPDIGADEYSPDS